MRSSLSPEPAKLLEESTGLIEQSISSVRRKYRLSADETDEIRSLTYLRLINDDYAALRRFRGKCSLRSYLTVVVTSVALDYRNRRWGKWRPSLTARRAGLAGMLMESLLARDGFSHHESIQIARGQLPGVSEAWLEDLAGRLPARAPRIERPLDENTRIESRDSSDGPLLRAELDKELARLKATLLDLISGLPNRDRLLLKLRFHDGLKTSQIARLLKTESRPLYPRIRSSLRRLRLGLESRGFSRAVALGENMCDL